MSVFTNRFTAAREEADAYVAAVLELLGDRDPMAVLAMLPEAIEGQVAGLTAEQLRQPEAPGKWSIVEVVQHLADSDLVWAYRLRTILAQDRAPITGYDQDRWAEALRYRGVAAEDALAQLRALRAANLRLLRSLAPEERKRVGVHSERGEESIELMIRLYAGHDLLHLRQLDRIRRTLGFPT